MNDAINEITQLRFSPAQVADAVGISLDTLNNWLRPDRGVATLSVDVMGGGGGHGRRREFTLRGAYQIALTAKLVARGLTPQVASKAALHFAGTGDEDRGPGELFAEGETFLCCDHESGAAEVVQIGLQEGFFAVLAKLPRGSARDWDFIDLSRVVWTVRQRLGLPAMPPS